MLGVIQGAKTNRVAHVKHSKKNTNINGEDKNHWATDNDRFSSFRPFNSVYFHLKTKAASVLRPLLKITVVGRKFKSPFLI